MINKTGDIVKIEKVEKRGEHIEQICSTCHKKYLNSSTCPYCKEKK